MALKIKRLSGLAFIFYALVIIFLAVYLKKLHLSEINQVSLNAGYLGFSVVLGLMALTWGAHMWLVILRGLGADIKKGERLELYYVYAKSWLGRYVPGTAPWILGKIYFASKHGIPKRKLAVSSLLEALLQLAATILVSLILIASSSRAIILHGNLRLILLVGTIGCLLLLIPKIFNGLLSLAFKILKRPALAVEDALPLRQIAFGVGLYSVNTLLVGLAMFFIAKAVYPSLGFSQLTYVMGSSTLAGAVGMMAVFVPSGIGVREGVQTVMLTAVMPLHIALLISVVARLWGVAVDLLFFGGTMSLRRYNTKTNPTD